MESFSIEVDLKSFFNDFRAKSVVFVDTKFMKKVKHVVKHIKTLFGIESKTCIFSNNNFVPGAEDSRVLKSLSNIRLETLISTNQCYNEGEDDENDKDQVSESAPIKNRKHDEALNGDKEEISDTGHTSKKKKHKRKRVDSDDCHNEYSTNQQGIPSDLSTIANSSDSSKDSKVRKTASSKPIHFSTQACSSKDHDKGEGEGTPNRRFYDKVQKYASKNDQERIEESQEGSALEVSNKNIAGISHDATNLDYDNIAISSSQPGDEVESDSNTTTDLLSSKPKRKRIRKRKKAAKPEVIPQNIETTVPETVRYFPPKPAKVSTLNSKHIYFAAEGEELETSEKVQEEGKDSSEDISVHSSSKCPDNNAETEKEEQVNHPTPESEDLVASADQVKNTGTDIVSTASLPVKGNIAQPKPYSKLAARGLGKLLSLVRSENPPVFERKKNIKTDQTPPPPFTKVPVLPPEKTLASPAKTPKAPLLPPGKTLNSSNSLSFGTLTPLKSIPEEKTKICFKILKMSASYCPELSNEIVAIVEDVNTETQELSLKIIKGAEECQKPKGKFDLDPDLAEEESITDEIKLKWQELIEPSSCQ